jgi:hypothetical protein
MSGALGPAALYAAAVVYGLTMAILTDLVNRELRSRRSEVIDS